MHMTKPTRIYKHSSVGTDWAALLLGAGLGLTLALQLTTVRKSDFTSVYASLASFSRLTALVGTYFAIVGIFLVARIPWVEKGVGHDRLVTWHRKLGPWSLYGIGAHVFFIVLSFAGQDSIPLYKELWRAPCEMDGMASSRPIATTTEIPLRLMGLLWQKWMQKVKMSGTSFKVWG
jgi:hypothetical protein